METENETQNRKRNFTQSLESLKDSQSQRQLDILNFNEKKGSQIMDLLEGNSDDDETVLVKNNRGVPLDASAAGGSSSDELPELIRLDGKERILTVLRLLGLKQSRSHKIMIQGIEVVFPFEPYDCQVAYMSKVIDALNGNQNALLQSPTGTGKTLCLLCATLAWINHYRNYYIQNPEKKDEYKPIQIFYASRTHSQLKQVIKELKQTCYRPTTAILGSKDQQCIKSDFTGLQRFQITAACKAARFNPITEQRCSYYDSYNKNKTKYLNEQKNVLLDIEELAAQGKKSAFCPYFLERDLSSKADLVMLPYHYVLDGRVRDAMNISLVNAIMIFDEAHNLERLTEDGCSFKVSTKDMEDCELDIKLIKQKLKRSEECKLTEEEVKQLEYPIMCLSKNLDNMKKSFSSSWKNKRKQFNQGNEESKSTVEEGRQIFSFFKENTCGNVAGPQNNPFRNGLDETNMELFINLVVKAIDDLSNVAISRGGIDNLGFGAMIIYNLMQIDSEAETSNMSWENNHVNSYMFQTDYEDEDDGPQFSFSLSCLYPGIGFEFVLRQDPKSIILTSGTLAPLRSFETEFATRFQVKLENNHVINTKTQCATFIVRSGPSGYPLNFSYDKRDDKKTYLEMGDTLLSIARQVPNGVLVVFASYGMMNKCLDAWENSDDNLLKKIEAIKTIYKEPRKQSMLNTTMARYLKEAKTKGAILCCVCRGKVSEGIDFADEMARAVVLIGIPFPAVGDMRVSYKKSFLTRNQHRTNRINGNQWYMQQTVRAINQAVGRVIRHIKDYGMVFLCDQRYGENQFKNEFPGWISDNLQVIDKFGFLLTKTIAFFKEKSQTNFIDKLFSQSQLHSTKTGLTAVEEKEENSAPNTQSSQQDSCSDVASQPMNKDTTVMDITNKYKQLDLTSHGSIQSSYQHFMNNMKDPTQNVKINPYGSKDTKKVKLNESEQNTQAMPLSALNTQKPAAPAVQEKPREKNVTFECPKCHKHTKVIMKADCGHIACEGCWKFIITMSPKCPVCKKKITPKELVKTDSLAENPQNTAQNQQQKQNIAPSSEEINSLLCVEELNVMPSVDSSPIKTKQPENVSSPEKAKSGFLRPGTLQNLEKFQFDKLSTDKKNTESIKASPEEKNVLVSANSSPNQNKQKTGFPRLGSQQSIGGSVKVVQFLEKASPPAAELNQVLFFEEDAQTGEDTEQSKNNDVECMVCYSTETKGMLVGKCGHPACKQCWQCIFLRRPACPTCKRQVAVEDLQPYK